MMFKSYWVTTASRPRNDTLICPQNICLQVLLLLMGHRARHWVSHPQITWRWL